jgi:hypothetical protein
VPLPFPPPLTDICDWRAELPWGWGHGEPLSGPVCALERGARGPAGQVGCNGTCFLHMIIPFAALRCPSLPSSVCGSSEPMGSGLAPWSPVFVLIAAPHPSHHNATRASRCPTGVDRYFACTDVSLEETSPSNALANLWPLQALRQEAVRAEVLLLHVLTSAPPAPSPTACHFSLK